MPAPANLPQAHKGLAVPFLLSLSVHGLLLSALWFCPSQPAGGGLAIETTRISLETCSIDAGEPSRNHEREFSPRLIEAPLAASDSATYAGPTLSIPSHAFRPAASSNSSRGDGPAISGSLFPLPAKAASVVYVIDRSVSMGVGNKLEAACRELLVSLRHLPAGTRFQIIAYNNAAEPLFIEGRNDLLPADPAIIEQAARAVERLTASGPTDHVRALRRALALHPDVLFFLTDADDLPAEQIDFLTLCNRGTAIHAIELTRGRQPRSDGMLARLARANRGSFRRVPIGD
jgi:hypothetical protein